LKGSNLADLAAIGHDPIGTLERLSALPDSRTARGNTDRYLITGERPFPTLEAIGADASLLPIRMEVEHNFAWTQGAVTVSGWLEWLSALPLEQRILLPHGSRLLGVHVAPGRDDGEGVHPGSSEAELKSLLAGC